MGSTLSSSMVSKKKKNKNKGVRRYLLTAHGGGGGGGGGNGGGNEAVAVCRERKRVVKKAVKQRQAFAEAHYNYYQSLSSVSSSLSFFISRHNNSQRFQLPSSDSGAHHLGPDPVEEGESERWDFFNLLGDDDDQTSKKVVGNQQGNERNGNNNRNGNQGKGRELWEALKEVESYFLTASNSGRHLTTMLELAFHPETPSKKIAVPSEPESWKSSLSTCSTSTSSTSSDSASDRKSLLSFTSHMENRSGLLVDGHWGMVSGSHSFTLGRLYAWEKKLYHEIKAGDQALKTYKQRCSQLRQKDVEGDVLCTSKATAAVKDLYHVMLVALQRADSISKKIAKLIDEELQPQLHELLQGLMMTWQSMLETHEIQRKIMQEIKSFSCPDLGNFYNNSHFLATLQLEAVIRNWHACFSDYVSAQKAYVKSLQGWLSKYVEAEAEYHYYYGSSSLPPIPFNGPPLLITCNNWYASLERLPDESVKYSMKSLAESLQTLWAQQGIQRKQIRKVDGLAKEMDKKIQTFKKAEETLLVSDISHCSIKDHRESFDTKHQMAICRKKLEVEREKYHRSLQDTDRLTMNRLKTGFHSVFESLTDFSRASVKVYADLVTLSQNVKA